MDERLRFVARLLDGEKMAALCREFDASRKTGYKIFGRYKDCGLEGLCVRRPAGRGGSVTLAGKNDILPRMDARAAQQKRGSHPGAGNRRRLATAVLALTGMFPLAVPLAAIAEPPAGGAYTVQPGDILAVSVWKEKDLQGDLLVRPDGGLSFPLAGDIQAIGHTVDEVRQLLEKGLKRYIPDPAVSVALKQIGGNFIYVIGKVNRPGQFPFSKPLDVMQALSLAGGMTPYAAVNEIRILQRDANGVKATPFHYSDVEKGRDLGQNIVLKSGDTVVVP